MSDLKPITLKTLTLLIALFITSHVALGQTAGEVLTNADIIALTKTGLDKTVIIAKLNGSNVDFDVTTDGLVRLGTEGVDPKVINAMMAKNEVVLAEKSKIDNVNNPLFLHNSGFYLYAEADSEKSLIKLDGTPISNYSSSNAGFGGFGKSSSFAHLTGANSKVPVTSASSEFYFHLNPDDNTGTSWWWEELSPNDFILVKLGAKDGDRVFVYGTASSSGFSSNSKNGIPPEDMRNFEYKEISKGIYKITFPEALELGEYMFMCTEASAEVYTFSKK